MRLGFQMKNCFKPAPLCFAASLLVALIAITGLAAFAQYEQTDPQKKVASAAEQSVGKRMWLGYGLKSGKLGCAAALCNVLKQAGYPYARSAAVVAVRNQLLASPARMKEISIKDSTEYGVDPSKLAQTAQPGDLIMGYKNPPTKSNLGADAHCGVVAGNGEVFANDWLDGIWKRDVADRFFAWYPHVYIMKFSAPPKDAGGIGTGVR